MFNSLKDVKNAVMNFIAPKASSKEESSKFHKTDENMDKNDEMDDYFENENMELADFHTKKELYSRKFDMPLDEIDDLGDYSKVSLSANRKSSWNLEIEKENSAELERMYIDQKAQFDLSKETVTNLNERCIELEVLLRKKEQKIQSLEKAQIDLSENYNIDRDQIMADHNSKIHKLEEENNKKLNEINEKSQEFNHTQQIEEKNNDSDDNFKIIKKLRDQLKEKDETIKRITREFKKDWEESKIRNEQREETISNISKNHKNTLGQLQEEIQEKKEEISKLATKYKQFKTDPSALKTQLASQTDKNEILSRKYSKLAQKYNEMKQLFIENEEKISKLEKKYQKPKDIKPQLDSQTDFSHKNQKQKEASFPQNQSFLYDIIINIDSLKSKQLGWEIEINRDLANIDKSVSIIGLVGRENVGKTFVLNKICGFDLPSGSNIHTKGLSLKYSEEKNLVCLDSAGLQTPVFYYDPKLLMRYEITKEDLKLNKEIKREMINDRTITDVFIQDFILEACEVIVIVVGQMSQNDQKFIERISMKYQFKKRIIVIHNFLNLKTKKDVENQIKKDIGKCFETVERYIPNSEVLEFVEKTHDKNKENISHLILGAINQESGLFYNKTTFAYLKSILDTRTEKRHFEIISDLKAFFEDNYRLYLQFNGRKPEKKVTLNYQEKTSSLKIVSDKDYEISNPLFNSLGNLVTNPPFEVIINENRYICLIDLPDIDEKSLSYKIDKKKSEFNCLVVNGMRNIGEDNKENGKRMGTRCSGEVSCVVPLGKNYLKVEIEKKKIRYDLGVLRVEVIKIEEENENL